ncbi:hypothetical protein PFICI_03093 [Pestalotiopsis fici W106-1]|uniref:Copper-fist domain-containing protein n=1 Tax=Pestalotiopsis fici (strain W106-1 / CGMCC3.15140) TaxID=1229662 RepID=W3XG43_PESFW|nr:uncharacterized protein PFICI_03093 [Pestalotiopsis fici W106-1]ETS85068.1 hypothetical protein PFICI_03093 [Pestalotiopsis fici W106-1]
MPLINGQKMACEPCIRGHRSTTCNHANERVMVPVRKPGRPLNECPHTRGSNCGCRDVTVAIPRKRKCECVGDKSAAPKTSLTQTSVEAIRPGNASISAKEQQGGEPSSCCKPKAPSAETPASIPPAMAPAPATASLSQPQAQVTPVHGNGASQWTTNWNWNFGSMNSSHIPQPFPGFTASVSQQPQPIQVQAARVPQAAETGVSASKRSDSDDEVEGRSSQEGSTSSSAPDEPASRSSCCSTRSSSTAQFATTPDSASPESSGASSYTGHSRSNSKSRATRKLRKDRQSVSSIATAVPQVMPETATRPAFPVMIQSPVSQMSMQPITAHPPACTNCGHNQPAILIYLPFGLPAQPVAYTGAGGGPVYVVQPAQPAPVNMPPPPQDFSRTPNPPMTAITVPMGGCASDTTGLGTLHECNCGPGCQCLGCIAHPFNDATREYIRSAQNAFDDFTTPYQSLQDIDSGAVPTAQSIANLTLSPEQTLASEDFFFIDYPSAQRTYPG